jgi:hypothetical protein
VIRPDAGLNKHERISSILVCGAVAT